MNKKQYNRKHSKERLKQRFNLKLNRKEWKSIINSIQKGRAQFVRKVNMSRSEFLVDVKGKKIAVIYSKKTKEIVTVLYPRWII